jgi:hypothetical protein
MSKVQLKTSHLLIDAELARQVLGDTPLVYLRYYPEKGSLLVASVAQGWFYKMHQGTQCMLKDKNLRGDKAIALHELLIDHNLPGEDRPLPCEIGANGRMLNVKV